MSTLDDVVRASNFSSWQLMKSQALDQGKVQWCRSLNVRRLWWRFVKVMTDKLSGLALRPIMQAPQSETCCSIQSRPYRPVRRAMAHCALSLHPQ